MADDDINEPPMKEWPVPSCGVGRYTLMQQGAERAADRIIVNIATEIVQHFKSRIETVGDVIAVLTEAEPSNHLLEQIYRHAFHPLHLVTIGEALACPAKTRRQQLQAAFVPIIGMASRVEYVAPAPMTRKPRKRSINPHTKDFGRVTRRIGQHLAFHASWVAEFPSLDLETRLAMEKDYRPEHRDAVMKAALAEAKEQVEWASKQLERARAGLAVIEKGTGLWGDEAPRLAAAAK